MTEGSRKAIFAAFAANLGIAISKFLGFFITHSAGLLAAAEEGLGYALASWTLVTRALQKGTVRLAGKGALPYGSAYYFVCPKNFLAIPKVAQFREWILAAAREFPAPGAPDSR